jgi:methyltransferase
VTLHFALLSYIVLARLAELYVANCNTRRLIEKGGYEVGRPHYLLMVILHLAWIVAFGLLIPANTPVQIHILSLFLLVQGLRYWVIYSLGERWTTRIIILPKAPLITHGPYKWLRHPNYIVVVLEIALLPLSFGAWEIALIFSILNAVVLYYRIKTEESALSDLRDA